MKFAYANTKNGEEVLVAIVYDQDFKAIADYLQLVHATFLPDLTYKLRLSQVLSLLKRKVKLSCIWCMSSHDIYRSSSEGWPLSLVNVFSLVFLLSLLDRDLVFLMLWTKW